MAYLVFLATLLVAALLTLALRAFGLRVQFGKIFGAIATALSWLPILLMHSLLVFMVEFAVWMIAYAVLDATGLLPYVTVPSVSGRHVVLGLALAALLSSLSMLLRAGAKKAT